MATTTKDQTADRALPGLIGTEKQITRAAKIRTSALESVGNLILGLEGTPGTFSSVDCAKLIPTLTQERREEADKLIWAAAQKAHSTLYNETSARWWIEMRRAINNYVQQERSFAYQRCFATEVKAYWKAIEEVAE
jgi:hypothetical protein